MGAVGTEDDEANFDLDDFLKAGGINVDESDDKK